jgi:hypothetical protein
MPTDTAIATVDAQTAYDLLAAAVELAGPDHVYESLDGAGCRYVHVDQPGCIVGVALAIHGVPLDVMDEWQSTIDFVDAEFVTGNAANVFAAAQRVQDRSVIAPLDAGATWGKALDAARTELDRINASA